MKSIFHFSNSPLSCFVFQNSAEISQSCSWEDEWTTFIEKMDDSPEKKENLRNDLMNQAIGLGMNLEEASAKEPYELWSFIVSQKTAIASRGN
ncbi:hypothetical protein K9L27_00540 [Candidatus Gracilibacteria bacterium]|nr:hypothetical protein [Candidatus Gracilibacteria bacterium]